MNDETWTYKTQPLFTTEFFIRDANAPDEDKKAGIKAGDKLHLSITWREATRQEDGSYRIRAYNHIAGAAKAEEITQRVIPEDRQTLPDGRAVLDSFKTFNDAFKSCENDTYEGPINKNAPLTETMIELHRKTSPKCAA